MKKISVVGLGYIGLPTALMFASHGINVIGTDYNKSLVDKLNNGETTFKEDGLDELFAKAVKNNIVFTSKYVTTDVYIISVPTPYDKSSKKIDATYVIQAVKNVLDVCLDDAIIVIESTISPGTIDRYIRPLIEDYVKCKGEKKLHIVHAPERIIPGNMIYELVNNSRTIGADSNDVGQMIKDLYSSFCKGSIVITDVRTAEMSKVIENTFRDINIAFANELAKICRSDNLNVYEIIKIANMHPRVNILKPGPGVGGHCISVDPWFLVGDYPNLANLIWTARKINDSMPEFVLNRIRDIMDQNNIVDISRVGIYGLTYKENVDDIRESPSIQLFEKMHNHLGDSLKSYDPFIKSQIVNGQIFDFDEFINGIDLIVVMVGHEHIKRNFNKLSNKIVLDTRDIYNGRKYTL